MSDVVTNSIPTQTGEHTLDQLIQWNDRLLGMPSGVLVLLLVFGFNCVFYYAEFFPNKKIPLFSIISGAVLYFLLSWKVGATTLEAPIWVTKNLVIGAIIGIAAWIFSLRYGQKIIVKLAGTPDPGANDPPKPTPGPAVVISTEVKNVSDKPKIQ